MSKWREVMLGEVADINKENIKRNYEGDILYVDISSVESGTLRDYKKYNFKEAPSRARRVVKDKDIIYSTVRPNLKAYYQFGENIPQNIIVSTGFVVLSEKVETSIDYIYYYTTTQSFVDYLSQIAKGAAYPAVSIDDFKNIKIKIPDLETQEKIADVLSSYDELIENNNRRIEILEKTAEEIYKEWFVRMRFPGYKETKFEKGIPEGWEVKKVEDLGEVVTGKTPSTKVPEYYGSEIMFIKTPDMNGNIFTLHTEMYLSEKGSNSQIGKLLPENSIMVSCIGTGGVVSINMEPAHTNQQINSIVLKDVNLREWAYFTLKSMRPTIELFGATGATMTNLSKGKFERLKILYPKTEIIAVFNQTTKDIFEEIKLLMLANQNLAHQRDLLLPRLMNGTIEVK